MKALNFNLTVTSKSGTTDAQMICVSLWCDDGSRTDKIYPITAPEIQSLLLEYSSILTLAKTAKGAE